MRDLYTCRNCQWAEQCQSPAGEICEYYDSLSEMEEEIEEQLLIDIGRRQFAEEWQEYIIEEGNDI